MKQSQLKLVLLLAVIGIFAKADIIQDNVVNGYKAGWFPSVNKSCQTICQNIGAKAEYELFQVPAIGNKYSFVCKSEVEIGGATPGKGTLYGNNFSSPNYAPFCMVSTPSGQVLRQSKFYCLCAY